MLNLDALSGTIGLVIVDEGVGFTSPDGGADGDGD